MGAERYEAVIVNAESGRKTKREWSASELVKGVPWLKRMNARGGDIYLRPLDGPELLLVDALNAEALDDMHRQGLAPALTIETSPGRFQAWVKVSDHPLPGGLREPAVAGLARSFPKAGEYGRLAGFTNQRIEPNPAGRQPFILARPATGKVAPTAQPYPAAIQRHLSELAAEKQCLIDRRRFGWLPDVAGLARNQRIRSKIPEWRQQVRSNGQADVNDSKAEIADHR
jgi:hypothetical protein